MGVGLRSNGKVQVTHHSGIRTPTWLPPRWTAEPLKQDDEWVSQAASSMPSSEGYVHPGQHASSHPGQPRDRIQNSVPETRIVLAF